MSEAYAGQPDTEGDPQEQQPANPNEASPFVVQAIGKPNLAFEIDDAKLQSIGELVVTEYKIDLESRKAEGYDEAIERAMKLAKLTAEAKSYPWPKASNVKYPLIIQAAIQFNARSYAALIDGPNIVKGKVLGQPTPQKRDRAERIGAHMSWQLLEEEDEWEGDTDELLLRLAIVGTLIRKRYFDPIKGRQCSHIIGPDKFVVNYWSQDLAITPRGTHELTFYPHEVLAKQRAGLWMDFDLGIAPGSHNDEQAPHVFLEQFRPIDLDGDGYPEPYIVTVHKETQKVCRIVARWYEDGITINDRHEVVSIEPYDYYTKYGFIPSPDGSFYDIGFGTLLGPLSETINTTINQIMDAGHLSNLQSGFIGEGVSIKSGGMRFQPGEWKKVATTGAMLKDNIVPLPTKEPSSVLFELMTFLVQAAKDLTATQDILTGDSARAATPVGTTLALIEQGLKTFTAIVKRIHRSLKRELGVMYALNARYLDPQVYFTFQDNEQAVAKQDYAEGDCDVVPVSDPNMATDMQRMGRAQFMMGLAGPDMDNTEIKTFAMETAGITDPKRFLPKGPPPPDPKLAIATDQIDLRHRELDIKQAESRSQIAVNEANAQKTAGEAFMASPQFQMAVAAFIDRRVEEQLTGATNGGQPVQQAVVPGMGGQPPHGAVPAPPQGPAGPPSGPMGSGPGDGPPAPDQGAAVPGAFNPQLG